MSIRLRRTAAGVALAALVPLAVQAAVPPPGSAAPTKYEVVAKVSSTQVEASAGTVRFTGRVRPWAAGERVYLLQRRSGSSRWTRTDSARLNRTSRFVLRDTPTSAGVRYYRVFKPPSDGLRGDRSFPTRVEVLRWERLTDLQPWAGCGLDAGVTVAIGGRDYPSSLALRNLGGPCIPYVVYDLQDRCRTLRATYGFIDGTYQEGAYGSATISSDDQLLESYQLTNGRIFRDEELDITGVPRLHIGLLVANAPPYPGGQVAAGTPEALCLP